MYFGVDEPANDEPAMRKARARVASLLVAIVIKNVISCMDRDSVGGRVVLSCYV